KEMEGGVWRAGKERSMRVAGRGSEQERIRALKRRPAPAPDAGTAKAEDGEAKPAPSPGGPASTTATESPLDQKAENGRITLKSVGAAGREEAFTLDLPRPAIPSAVVALVTRNQSTERPSQMG